MWLLLTAHSLPYNSGFPPGEPELPKNFLQLNFTTKPDFYPGVDCPSRSSNLSYSLN